MAWVPRLLHRSVRVRRDHEPGKTGSLPADTEEGGSARQDTDRLVAKWHGCHGCCIVLSACAETMSKEKPDRYLPTLKKVDRRGKILIDWLRNGMGATAVASFCPRARRP